jgi:hypothetical protein
MLGELSKLTIGALTSDALHDTKGGPRNGRNPEFSKIIECGVVRAREASVQVLTCHFPEKRIVYVGVPVLLSCPDS